MAVNGELLTAQGDRRFLLVRAGGVGYAIAADQVRHVARGLACHPLPGSRPQLLGLAQYAGEPLAVLDLHAIAEGGAAQSGQWVTVILGRGESHSWSALGLAVDAVLRVGELGLEEVGEPSGRLIAGVVTLDGVEVKVLDTSLLTPERYTGGETDG